MKKFCLLLAAFVSLVLIPLDATAQTADALMDRYLKVSGFEGFSKTQAGQSVLVEMNVSSQGMNIPIKGIIKYPLQMRFEMSMNGQDMLMVLNGNRGWMVVGGQKQPLPGTTIDQMAQQNDLMGNMVWDKTKFDLQLLEPLTKDGKKYDVLKLTPKVKLPNVNEQTVYFDNATGFISYVETTAENAGQTVDVKVVYGDIQTMNGVKMPKNLTTYMNGMKLAEIDIKNMQFNYPTEEQMFAEPQ